MKHITSELESLINLFGKEAAERKKTILSELSQTHELPLKVLSRLNDMLCFMKAYPDNPAVLRSVCSLASSLREKCAAHNLEGETPALENEGFPGAINRNEYSLPWIAKLARRWPSCFEIDWEEFEWEGQNRLLNALGLLTTPAECQGLDDISIDLCDWFRDGRAQSHKTDLDFLLDLFSGSELQPQVRDYVFESCQIPIRYQLETPGTGRCEINWPTRSVHYQRKPLDRSRIDCSRIIKRPFAQKNHLSVKFGADLIDCAQRALSARNLEIRTLTYGNPRDVTLVDCGRGLTVALVGVIPHYRDPLECHYFCFLMKNGTPIAYGPGTVSMGCCEIGLNLFPEFRGAEVRFLYPQLMRSLYQIIGARYFFLTPYGMGENNAAAIKTGAFWFYRKLGFKADNAKVEELALQEELRMKAEPGYRSDKKMLRRLSHTSAYFDLSDGSVAPINLGAIGLQQSRFIAAEYAGDRQRAVSSSILQVRKKLGAGSLDKLGDDERRGWQVLAPILAAIPDLESWSKKDKILALRIIKAKGGPSETKTDMLMRSLQKLCIGVRALSES